MSWDGEWCDPPATAGNAVWPERLAPLRERPGEWARFGPYVSTGTSKQVLKIKRGTYGPGFEARRRLVGRHDWIYVRFVGASLEVVA